MSSNILVRPRLHASVLAFVRQARSSGLEKDWINLISGKNVDPQRLEQLDKLIVDVLKNPSPQEFELDRSQPWAELRPDTFTHRNVLQYEIPRSTREKLRDEALKETKDEAAAKQLYRQKLSTLRNQLIRKYAVKQTEPVVPPLRVNFQEQNKPDPQAYETIARIKTYPDFMAQVVDTDPVLTSFFYEANSPKRPKPQSDPQNAQELLKQIQAFKTDSTDETTLSIIAGFEKFVQELDAELRQQQEQAVQHKLQPRNPADPDWDILLKNPHIPQAFVNALREDTNALRKLFYPAQIQVEESLTIFPQIYAYLGALKKMEKISKEKSIPVLNLVEGFAKRYEQMKEDKYFWANWRIGDNVADAVPEIQEQVEKHLVNQNWLFEYYNPTQWQLPFERR